MNIKNPFPITGYISPEYFCDREEETQKIISAIANNRNLTLLSLRRMGKTGLIKHVFHHLESEKEYRLLYFDILSTTNTADFVREFSKVILLDERKYSSNFFKKLLSFLTGIRAKIVFDNLTGAPEIEFDYQNNIEIERSIEAIFEYIGSQKTDYVIAIDEFQQIVNYPEKNLEALLRTHVQQRNNVHFIFSGSNKHLLLSMFSDYGRPFYQSSEIMYLNRLDKDIYADFIMEKFTKVGKNMDRNLVLEMLNQLHIYTFYVQYFFNRLFEISSKNIDNALVTKVMENILLERDYTYINYRNLLTTQQFNLLKAIAKEENIQQINSQVFLKKYNLGSASTVNRAIKALIDKEMVYEESSIYRVYDVFFEKWLQRL
ncbi:MAG: AAA family ATPase [Dysgonamonadaceae bacterium]|jgi:hypothetical protein|nr:AAA family ATPase [Dysgonamonadaceae bacterium]